jgi:hypothetical protein
MLIILHFISIIIPAISMLIKSSGVQKFLYWLFNIISPSINAQAIITYILAKKSALCERMAHDSPETNQSIGDDTIGGNIALLILHTLLLLALLIVIDSGLLQFSCSSLYVPQFDENKLDSDVLAERHRVLGSTCGEEDEHIDHLTVNNLVKFYSRRNLLAVNHLTFGAKRGEAFGLLGYNVS